MITIRNSTSTEVLLDKDRFEIRATPPLKFTLSSELSFGWRPLAMPPFVAPHGVVRGEVWFLVEGRAWMPEDPDHLGYATNDGSNASIKCPIWPVRLTVHLPDGDYYFQFDEKSKRSGAVD